MSTAALHLVLQQAEADRDAAVAQLTQLTDLHARFRSQQGQLTDYRREYHARWTAQFRSAGTPEVLQHYQGFVERLNHALEQLDLQMQTTERQIGQARELLIERETRVMALKRLIERRDQQALKLLQLRDQKQADELAARMAWQTPGGLVVATATA